MNQQLHGFVDLTNEQYHASAGISKSHCDVAAKSAQAYWARYIDPNRTPTEPTEAMKLGTFVHAAVLEPDTVQDSYIVVPEDAPRRPTTAQMTAKKPSPETLFAIDWWEAFTAKAEGKQTVTQQEWETAWACRKAIFSDPFAAKILAQGKAEQSIYATDPDTGLLLKCRPDWMRDGIMADIKSTKDASPAEFFRTMGKLRYHIQHPFYGDVFKHAFGGFPEHFFWIAVETEYPHNVGVYYLTPEQIVLGREQYRKDLTVIRDVRSGNGGYLGGYTAKSGPVPADIPAYFFK